MVKYSFMVLIAVLFFACGTTSLAREDCILGEIVNERKCADCHPQCEKEENYKYDTEEQIKAEILFKEFENYLNYQAKKDPFLNAIDAVFGTMTFYGKVTQGIPEIKPGLKDKYAEIPLVTKPKIIYYSRIWIRFANFIHHISGLPYNSTIFTIDNSFSLIKNDLPVFNGSHPRRENMFFAINNFKEDEDSDKSIEAAKWVKVYTTIAKYVEKFRLEQQSKNNVIDN